MDYSNESWIKVYTRDTASWRSTSLAARGLALELSRNMGRFTNEISLGARGLRAVAALVGAPWEEVRPLLDELLADGRLLYDEERQVLCDPDHLERQGVAASSAQRKRDSRARGSSSAPKVTRRHVESRDVTSSHDQREEIEQTEESEIARAPEGVAVAPEPEPEAEVEPEPGPPALAAPLPDDFRELGADIVRQTGVVDVDLEASWRAYVGWLHERDEPASAGRWVRWVANDCSEAAARRRRHLEREWRAPKPLGRRSLFAVPDVAPAPYHSEAKGIPMGDVRVSDDERVAALKRAGLA